MLEKQVIHEGSLTKVKFDQTGSVRKARNSQRIANYGLLGQTESVRKAGNS